MKAEAVSKPHAFHGEGVIWGDDWGGGHSALRYVDMLAGDILELRPDGDVERFHVGTIAAALRPRIGGGAVIGVERSFALTASADFSDLQTLPDLWAANTDPKIRFNDGGCAPDGSFYMGSMAYNQQQGAASMYRLDARDEVVKMWDDVTISNGICWTPDGTRCYYNDTATGMIQMLDYENGTLTNRRPFVTIEDGAGHPDGLTVDAEGGVWTALYGGSAARRYDENGNLSEVVEVGPTNVTCVGFGGAGMKSLYITTSRENLKDGEQPEAGGLFVCEPGVSGQPTQAFAG